MNLTWLPPRLRPTDPEQRIAYLEKYVAELEVTLQGIRKDAEEAVETAVRREVAALQQADALRAKLPTGETAPAELARLRRTVTIYEDMLAACRNQHGGNVITGQVAR